MLSVFPSGDETTPYTHRCTHEGTNYAAVLEENPGKRMLGRGEGEGENHDVSAAEGGSN